MIKLWSSYMKRSPKGLISYWLHKLAIFLISYCASFYQLILRWQTQMGATYREERNRWLASLEVKAGTVLDLGGSQLPVMGRTKSWEVNNYYIADLADPHADNQPPEHVVDLNYEPDRPFLT